MEDTLTLRADEEAVSTMQVVDIERGDAREETVSPGEPCQAFGVRSTPMTEAVCDIVLYRKNGSRDCESAVTLRDSVRIFGDNEGNKRN